MGRIGVAEAAAVAVEAVSAAVAAVGVAEEVESRMEQLRK